MRKIKFSPVWIGVIALVLIALTLLIISLVTEKNDFGNDSEIDNSKLIAPVIQLTLNTSEEEQEKVIIFVSATTEDDQGIEYIVLPDGTKIFTDYKEYEVAENGNYEFKAVGYNGAEDSLIIDVTNIREASSNDPYIPSGFKHVSGEVEKGYTICDKYGNEYVWVPVPSGILTRTTNMNSEYEESNNLATALVNSVAKNYGFYIARFEASSYEKNGVTIAASMKGQIPWTNLYYKDAYNASEAVAQILEYTGVSTALINSYAWDTVLSWFNESVAHYSTNTSYGNYSGTIYPTGTTKSDIINNICDIAGNVREWTTEIYKSTTVNTNTRNEKVILNRVIRGGSASINKIANSRNGYPENLTDSYWGFRTVLYKNN